MKTIHAYAKGTIYKAHKAVFLPEMRSSSQQQFRTKNSAYPRTIYFTRHFTGFKNPTNLKNDKTI